MSQEHEKGLWLPPVAISYLWVARLLMVPVFFFCFFFFWGGGVEGNQKDNHLSWMLSGVLEAVLWTKREAA